MWNIYQFVANFFKQNFQLRKTTSEKDIVLGGPPKLIL